MVSQAQMKHEGLAFFIGSLLPGSPKDPPIAQLCVSQTHPAVLAPACFSPHLQGVMS